MSTRLRQRDTIASTIAGAKMIDMLLEWASVGGRANRKPYWLIMLAMLGISFVFGVVAALAAPEAGKTAGAARITLLCILALPIFYILWIGIAVTVRRLHDRDKSAWWILGYIVLPVALDVVAGDGFNAAGPEFVLEIASIAISVWGLVDLGFLKGTTGPNRYGPDPLAAPQAMADATAA